MRHCIWRQQQHLPHLLSLSRYSQLKCARPRHWPLDRTKVKCARPRHWSLDRTKVKCKYANRKRRHIWRQQQRRPPSYRLRDSRSQNAYDRPCALERAKVKCNCAGGKAILDFLFVGDGNVCQICLRDIYSFFCTLDKRSLPIDYFQPNRNVLNLKKLRIALFYRRSVTTAERRSVSFGAYLHVDIGALGLWT